MEKTAAIDEFLSKQSVGIKLYTPALEVQVNKVGDKKGGFRIPNRGSGKDAEPEYKSQSISWSLYDEAEAIGLTGWDWFHRQSHWVGFDIDSITNHKAGISDSEIQLLVEQLKSVPWVTLYRSKSGRGIHVYVFFQNPIPTKNHFEHSQLARAILNSLSVLLGADFADKVDVFGHVLWVWHRDASREKKSFELLRRGNLLSNVPTHWNEHIPKRSRKINTDDYNALLTKATRVPLDETHRLIIRAIEETGNAWWWNEEYNLLVTHTETLRRVHDKLKLKGIFRTLATGKDLPADYNCFCFPGTSGSFTVRRFGITTKEDDSWVLDSSGWRHTVYNALPDLSTLTKLCEGLKDKNGNYLFKEADNIKKALGYLQVDLEIPKKLLYRQGTLAKGKLAGELVISIKAEKDDEDMDGWYRTKSNWECVIQTTLDTHRIPPPDDTVRHAVSVGVEDGWYLKGKEGWIKEPKDNITLALTTTGLNPTLINRMLGQAVVEPWLLVNEPFKEEFPGNRKWNKGSAQFSVEPIAGKFPYWERVIDNIGRGFEIEEELPFADGQEYLFAWLSALVQEPTEPLPYVFLWSRSQDTGKSILHEGMQPMFRGGIGYTRADYALTNSNGFNGELYGAVLCVIEETDLNGNKTAHNRAKDWVTGRTIAIRALHKNMVVQNNTTHWLHCANDASYCPVFPGDTRISMCHVQRPEKIIPKKELLAELKNELPHFLYALQNFSLPAATGRLRIPSLSGGLKADLEEINKSSIDLFLDNHCVECVGNALAFELLYNTFLSTLAAGEQGKWTKNYFGRELTGRVIKGKYGGLGAMHIANICLKTHPTEPSEPLTVHKGRLIKGSSNG